MEILEQMLVNWTKPPSDTEESKCENAVRMVREAINSNEELKQYQLEVFAQGSYRNNTNVKLNSDVDVIVRNMSAFFPDYPGGKAQTDFGNVDSNIRYDTFKNQVKIALIDHFGEKNIKLGDKAIDVLGNDYRIETDVVPCMEHRRYTGETGENGEFLYHSGVEFISASGNRIISWPKQHYENGIIKNNATGRKFKKVVRVLRRLNYLMCDKGIPGTKNITGYLIECLCWNVHDNIFIKETYTEIVKLVLVILYEATLNNETVKEWREISELKYLFRSYKPWTYQNVNEWTVSAWNYLGFKN